MISDERYKHLSDEDYKSEKERLKIIETRKWIHNKNATLRSVSGKEIS